MESNKPCNSGFPLPFFPLVDRRSRFLWFLENPNKPAKFFIWQIFIVDTELLAVKDNQLFIPAALEIFDCFEIFFQFIGNGGLGRTLTVAPFMGARSFPVVWLLPLIWIISHFPQSWKFLIFTPNSYFVDIRHRAQKCSMIQVVHRWIIPIEWPACVGYASPAM